MKDRTWFVAGAIVIVVFWTVMIFSAREWALFKSGLKGYFLLHDQAIDRDIAILKDRRILGIFSVYSVLLTGFIPVALQKIFRKVAIGLMVIAILFVPCVWYGNRVIHVFGKMIDWAAVFGELQQ